MIRGCIDGDGDALDAGAFHQIEHEHHRAVRGILRAGDVVSSKAKHLRNNVGGCKHRGPVRRDLSAFFGILGIRIPGLDPGPRLNVNFESGLGQRRESRWHQCHPPFSWITLFRNTYDHVVLPV